MLKRIFILLSVFLSSSPLYADTNSHRKAADELFLMINLKDMNKAMAEEVVNIQNIQLQQLNIPSGMKKKSQEYFLKIKEMTEKELGWDSMKEDYIDLYVDVYTEDEIRNILNFYKSPSGKKFIEKTPLLSRKTQELFQKKMEIVIPKTEKAVAELMNEVRKFTPPPKEDQLRKRLSDYFSALSAKDYKAMYEMNPPFIREKMRFEEWERGWGLDRPQEKQSVKKIIKAELEESCSCGPWTYENGSTTTRCVLLIRITVEDAEGRHATSNLGAMWEYFDGEWYVGWPLGEMDRCR